MRQQIRFELQVNYIYQVVINKTQALATYLIVKTQITTMSMGIYFEKYELKSFSFL